MVWNRNVFDKNCVLMPDWIIWNTTDYLYKNRFGVR